MSSTNCDGLKKLIREVPDFPKPGILFYDITTLLKDKAGFATLIDSLSEQYIGKDVDLVLGMEARGFIFAPALAYRLNAGFVPVRKPGKLPAETAKLSYDLEYGSNTLEIHTDAIKEKLIPQELTKLQISFVYANEADMLNVALFGKTALQWRTENPVAEGNIRDTATIEQLVVLSNMESINALLIHQQLTQSERLVQLNQIAITQMKSLLNHQGLMKLK